MSVVGEQLGSVRSQEFRERRVRQPVPARARPLTVRSGETATGEGGRDPEFAYKLALAARAVRRLILPVAGLFSLLALAYLYRTQPAELFDTTFAGINTWLSLGAVGLPLTFLAVHLTNRRYGPGVAAAQILVTWLIVALAALIYPLEPRLELGAAPAGLESRMGLALAVALILAQCVALVAFDAMRSVRWWNGPLHGFLWACIVFALVFFPAAYFGSGAPWVDHLGIYLGVSLMVSALSMVVYWIARPLVPPLPGFAGY